MLWEIALVLLAIPVFGDSFKESLKLRPLQDGKVSAAFDFSIQTQWDDPIIFSSNVKVRNSHFSPLSLEHLFIKDKSQPLPVEVHLQFVRGRWDSERWGIPDGQGGDGGGEGTEMWAWIRDVDGDRGKSENAFVKLTSSFSGLFCGSLPPFSFNSDQNTATLDPSVISSPLYTHAPKGNFSFYESKYQVFRLLNPTSHPCTENLTPFLRLLPCSSSPSPSSLSGFASLLNPHKLFEASYQKLSLHILSTHDLPGDRNTLGHVLINLKIDMVFDPISSHLRAGGAGRRDFSLNSLFGRKLSRSCPVADNSQLFLRLPDGWDEGSAPQPDEPERWTPDDKREWAIYDISSLDRDLDVTLRWEAESRFSYPTEYDTTAPISVRRVRQGKGVERGRMGVEIENFGDVERNLVWVEQLPWWIEVFWHSKTIKVLRHGVLEQANEDMLIPLPPRYTPAQARKRMTTIEHPLVIPPHSTVHISFNFQPAFLRYTEYPPDPHRGFDVPSALVILLEEGKSFSNFSNWQRLDGRRIYSSNSLVVVPTPDFSMPYNVITMTCTLIMLCWGGMFNVCVRKLKWVVEAGKVVEEKEKTD